MKIIIETIPHSEQRYPTTGDWVTRGEDIHVLVSDLSNWRMETLVGIHEAIEALLCRHAGVTQEQVDEFDTQFESARSHYTVRTRPGHGTEFKFLGGWIPINAEPGDHPDAPYYRQHQVATGIERILATLLDVDWSEYEEANRQLYGG